MFTTWRETLSYITRMGVGAGSRVLVIGSGGNGLSFAAHAVSLGAAPVAMVGSPRVEEAARKAGVRHYFDYSDEDVAKRANGAVPQGFDVIIDAVGKAGQADRLLPCLAPGGTLGVYGLDDFAAVSVLPSLARGTFTLWDGGYDEAETHQRVSDMVLAGLLDARLWYDLDHPTPLADIASAFAALRQRKAAKVLISLVPSHSGPG